MKKLFFVIILGLMISSLSGSEIKKVQLSDGESILCKIELPTIEKSVPAIVIFVPGTGPNTYLNRRKLNGIEFNYFDLFSQEFTKRGLGFLSYNRRGVEISDVPPMCDKVDSIKFSKYLPMQEAQDVESIITTLRQDQRFKNSKIILMGASEGTVIAPMIADRKNEKIDGLLLFGYVNENLSEIIKWQFSGAASILNLRKYFDKDRNNIISKEEFEANDSATVAGKKLLRNLSFEFLDINKDNILDLHDFGERAKPSYEALMGMINNGNDAWIWKNYFRVTSKWLKEHFNLEPNKTRMLRLDIPIFIFQGVDDGSAPVEGVYAIQSEFKESNKNNLKCFIFEGHNHDLNYLDWPFKHEISKGLKAIFDTSEIFLK